MDITSMAGAISDNAAAKTAASAAILVQRKAMDIAAQNAQTLLDALPTPPSNPAHLGNNIDVRA